MFIRNSLQNICNKHNVFMHFMYFNVYFLVSLLLKFPSLHTMHCGHIVATHLPPTPPPAAKYHFLSPPTIADVLVLLI